MDRSQRKDWKLKDLIRFEFYRVLDRKEPLESLEKRDREIFRKATPFQTSRRSAFFHWLVSRTKSEPFDLDPAPILLNGWRSIVSVGFVFSFLVGIALMFGLLSYDGRVPVNVWLVLGITVVPQLILLAFMMLMLVFSIFGIPMWRWSYRFPRIFLAKLLSQAEFSWASKISDSADRKRWLNQLKAAGSVLQNHKNLITTRLFRFIQSIGIGLNMGFLLCLWIVLLFTDRAFGWQSSLIQDTETAHHLFRLIASPWEWWTGHAFGGLSPEVVRESRIILAEKGQVSSLEGVSVWWSFICMSIVTYGLLPRLFFWLLSWGMESVVLRKMNFESIAYRDLWSRMHSVEFSSKGVEQKSSVVSQRRGDVEANRRSLEPYNLLIPNLDEESAIQWVSTFIGSQPSKAITTVDELREVEKLNCVMLIEGWQPPIEETMSDLKAIASNSAVQSLYLVLLERVHQGSMNMISDDWKRVWREKLRASGVDNVFVVGSPKGGIGK